MARRPFPRGGIRTRLPVTIYRRSSDEFSPTEIEGLALWLDASDSGSTYTTDAGPVVAVASPLDIAGCLCWYDAADASSITKDGSNLVSQWNDKSGNARHATASGSLRPTSGGSQNGRTVMQFTGTQAMTITGNFLQSDNVTMFAVAMKNTDHYGGIISSAPSNPEDSPVLTFYLTTIAWLNRRVLVQQATGNGVYRIVSGQSVGTAQQGFFDGVRGTDTVTATPTNTINTITKIGALRTGSSPDLNGNIAEIVCYSGNLSTAQRASVESYLAAKWAISGVHRSAAQEIAAVASPTEIGGLTEWFDATDTSGTVTTVAGNKVSSWASKVAGGRTLTQATDSLRPVMTDNIQNGLRMAKFDGVDDFIRTATPETFADKTVFIVARPTNVTADQAVWGASKQSITVYGYYYSAGFRVNSASALVRPETAGVPSRRIAASANEAIITSLQFKTSELVAGTFSSFAPYKNGTLFDTNDSVILSDYAIGSTMGANDARPAAGVLTNFYSGYVGEVLIYDAYLSAVDRARVEKYLQQKWLTPTVPDPTPPVGYWADKSGNGRHAVQSLAGSRPVVGTQNSRKALTFDGSNDNVSLTPASPIGSSAFTAIAAIKHNLTSQPLYLASPLSLTAGNQGRPIERWQGGSSQSIVTIGAVTSNVGGSYRSFPDRFVHGIDALKDGISSGTHQVREFLNGATNFDISNNGSWAVTSQRINVGTRDDNGTQYKGDICELCVYDRRLTTTERQRVERYLAARWGITLAPQVSNPDAQDWINRVYQNGGTVSSATAQAVNTFCDSIASAGIRDRFLRLNLFCGTGLNACLTPLYRAASFGASPLGNATDTNQGPFAAGAYTEATGLTPVFASGHYLDTGLTPDAMPLSVVQAMHLAFSNGPIPAQSPAAYPHLVGAANNPADRHYLGSFEMLTSGSATLTGQLGKQATTTAAVLVGANPSSSWVLSRTNATSLAIYQNGSLANTNTSSTTGIASYSRSFFVFKTNFNGSAIGDSIAMPGRHYSIGAGLTGPEVSSYNSALSSFFSAIGRTA